MIGMIDEYAGMVTQRSEGVQLVVQGQLESLAKEKKNNWQRFQTDNQRIDGSLNVSVFRLNHGQLEQPQKILVYHTTGDIESVGRLLPLFFSSVTAAHSFVFISWPPDVQYPSCTRQTLLQGRSPRDGVRAG